jgi:hypothetical protein
VAATVKRAAGVKGDLDAFGAMHFLAGFLTILRDSGRSGLFLVLDEAETLQRIRADVREKGLNALRQLLDELDAGRYPGLYLVVTGTTAFFEGRRACSAFPHSHTRFDNPRAVQVRLQGFDLDALAVAAAAPETSTRNRHGTRPGSAQPSTTTTSQISLALLPDGSAVASGSHRGSTSASS